MAAAVDAGLIVLHDAKRGDIGISAEHYAAATFESAGAQWITANPWLGRETLEPYLARGGTCPHGTRHLASSIGWEFSPLQIVPPFALEREAPAL